jgi:hypothetical protein
MNGHTFLFEPGRWRAKGHYWDDEGKIVPLEGESRVEHGGGAWTLAGQMKLYGQQLEIVNNYAIVPFAEGRRTTTWQAHNPALGRMIGSFTVIADTILSAFTSEDGRFHGSEALIMQSPMHYLSRGVLMKGAAIVSTWSVALQKIA